jgi:hypothetical protein
MLTVNIIHTKAAFVKKNFPACRNITQNNIICSAKRAGAWHSINLWLAEPGNSFYKVPPVLTYG